MKHSKKNFEVSIVIISWKMRDLLERMLKSLYNFTTELNFEVILIDNNSSDGTIEMIENEFPSIKLIKNSENRGVAPARNQGLEIASGKYVVILDADMELVENSIIQLREFMERNPDCGLVGCKLVDTEGNLQFSCKRFPNVTAFLHRRLEVFSFFKNSKTLKHHTIQEWDHNSVKEVDYLIGACQFIRKDALDQIGFYDDKIFYGPEDIDFCLRMWRAGWKVMYYPFTRIIHHEQRITKQNYFSVLSLKHLKGIFYIFKKYNWKLKV